MLQEHRLLCRLLPTACSRIFNQACKPYYLYAANDQHRWLEGNASGLALGMNSASIATDRPDLGISGILIVEGEAHDVLAGAGREPGLVDTERALVEVGEV